MIFSIGGLLRIHISRVVRGLADWVRCSSISCHCFMISWGSWRLHGVRGRIPYRVRCYWHSRLRLDSHRLISLIGGYLVAGWCSLLLGVGSMNHCSGSSGGHNRPRSSTCFIQTATRTSEAQNNSNYNHRKNSNSNRSKGSKTCARCRKMCL